jgi:hypothetical protein
MTTELLPPLQVDHLHWDSIPTALQQRFNALLQDQEFVGACTRRDLIGIACQALRGDEDEARVSLSAIATFFAIAKASVQWQDERYRDTIRQNGCPKTLPPAAYAYITELVQAQFAEKKPVIYRLIQDAIKWRSQIELSADTLRYMCRDMPDVKRLIGLPMDNSRVHCDQRAVADFYDELEAVIDGIPAEFVYNVDEGGCSEWADRPAEMIVLVPADFDQDRIFVPTDRHSKRSTMVGCIAGDGSAMKMMIIVDIVTMEDDLQFYEYDPRKALMVSQSNTFMTTALFVKWADKVFFPRIEDNLLKAGYQGPAPLILDECSSHHPPEFLVECERRNIYALLLYPYSSDQCQALGLVTFGLVKRYLTQFTFDALPSAQSNKVVKMMGAWYQATAPHQIVSAWLSMGFMPIRGVDGVVHLKVDRNLARAVRGWGEENSQILPFGPADQ